MITDGKIIEILLNSGDVDLVLNMIDSTLFLLKKFGKNLNTKIALEKVKENSEDLYSFIVFFDKLNKLNKKELNKIKIGLKNKFAGYTKTFEVSSSSENALKNVSTVLTAKLGKSDINECKSDVFGLSVAGDGLYFKRNLDMDLNKLLD